MLVRQLSPRLTYSPSARITPKRADKASDLKDKTRSTVMEKISSGAYAFEVRPCPGCASSHLDVVSDVERHGLYFPMAICRDCGLVHANAALREDDYTDFYTHHFRRLYNAREGMPSLKMLEGKKRSNLEQIGRLVKRAPIVEAVARTKGKRLLDVGCGGGNFTWAWKEFGFQATGIDLNAEYQDVGRANGLDLHAANLAEFVKDRTFDVVFYHHVLEHIREPVEELKIAFDALAPDGLLIVVVPGLRSAPRKYLGDLRDYFHIAHVTAFTKKSLTHVAAKAGFKPIFADNHVYAVFQKAEAGEDLTKYLSGPKLYEDTMRFMIDLEGSFLTEVGVYRMLELAKARASI